MLKVATGAPRHPPAKQLSHPNADQRLLPVLLRPQPQHRGALQRKEEGERGAEQGLGCMCCLRKGAASRLLPSRIFLEWSGQKTRPPGRSRTKTTQFSHSDFQQLFHVSQVRFSCGSTPAEGNWEQPMGNEVGQGGAGLWDLCVPALEGHSHSPGHSTVGKLNPYVSDVNFSVPEVGIEDVGQWD